MDKPVVILKAMKADDGSAVNIAVPIEVQLRFVRRNEQGIKAIAKVKFMGITINDIQIKENRGELNIVYPFQTYMKNGEERRSTVVFPSDFFLSAKINHAIQNEYSYRMLERSKDPISTILFENVKRESAEPSKEQESPEGSKAYETTSESAA